jgi:hypothetical protein
MTAPDTAALRRDHYDYDSDGHCDECGERYPCTVRALCDAADEVERLTSLVNAKQSWIDGAKVDLDGYADDQAEYEVAVRAIAAERDASRAEVERLRANRDALREQVQRLRASRESNRGGWARTLAERDALRAAVDRVRALGERDGRDRLAAWLASNGVEQPDTVAVEAAAFVLAALESGNYGTTEWFSSIDKPLFPLEAESSCPACERDASRTAHCELRDWLEANAPAVLADFDQATSKEDQ